jgi:hypothetical protein
MIERMIISLLLGTILYVGSVEEAKVLLKGRVLAVIDSSFFGSATGYRYQQFIFGIESENGQSKEVVAPVLITYSSSTDLLPKDFFDHSKLYVLHVLRKAYGDISLESIAYIKIVDVDNKEIDKPIPILKLLDGVPTDILKMDMRMQNYELLSGDYKIVRE